MESRWPPRSPHEALLSSPGGRDKVRRLYNRTSPSPSPIKQRPARQGQQSPSKTSNDPSKPRCPGPDLSDDEDGDDEEALELKLQAIEAKLRLKRLRQKRQTSETHSSSTTSVPTGGNPSHKENVPPSPGSQRQKDVRNAVQVQVSPQRKAQAAPVARSPGRVLLGIDKGLTGREVSLRRPKAESQSTGDPFVNRVRSADATKTSKPKATSSASLSPHRKTFGDRLAESRKHDSARFEREVTRHARRSDGFDIQQADLAASKEKLEAVSASMQKADSCVSGQNTDGFSRAQILDAMKKSDPGVVHRSRRARLDASAERSTTSKVWVNPNCEPELCQTNGSEAPKTGRKKVSKAEHEESKKARKPDDPKSKDSTGHLFESFSTLHLSKRLLTHDLLTRTFSAKSVLRIPDLLANVKAPDFLLPDHLDGDFVVLGIIATKSSPLNHKEAASSTRDVTATSSEEATTSAQNAKGKFLVLQLTDLKWTIDLFLFTTAYTRFYKLTPGTVVAILNPGIMPPQPHKIDTGRFSLTLHSSDDTILEVGTARDLGWCKATRKDGKQCPDWIDKRHTEFCEFHVDRVVEKNRRGRMEVNGISAPFAPGVGKKGRMGNFGGSKRKDELNNRGGGSRGSSATPSNNGFREEGWRYDLSTSSSYFVAPPVPGISAARLLDREDMMIGRGETIEERARKRLAEREKEKEIAKALGNHGDGAGSQYMRNRQEVHASTAATGTASQRETADIDAASLGLMGNKAVDVHLSPLKKANLKRKDHVSAESARKKTRFITEKGIRIAGRESLGQTGPRGGHFDVDDDDELVIE